MSKSSWPFRILVTFGFVVALWDFARLFSGWVVASQREVGAISVLFLFCGVLPLVGVIACCLRRQWGAWILLVSPWVAALALFAIHGRAGDRQLLLLLFILPTSILGLMFQRLLAKPVSQS